jgi:hypothetical protein
MMSEALHVVDLYVDNWFDLHTLMLKIRERDSSEELASSLHVLDSCSFPAWLSYP